MNMREIRFSKMHGLGNDYVYINSDLFPLNDPSAFAVKYSDRRKGIGGDGLILYGKGDEPHYRMRIFNIDGSEGLMCGNAIRCVAKLLYEQGLEKKEEMTILTASGEKHLYLSLDEEGKVEVVRVDMGAPEILDPEMLVPLGEKVVKGVHVDVGNPHLVHFLEGNLWEYPLADVGPQVEEHTLFQPGKVNFEIVNVLDNHTVDMRVWERGSGLTMACGTGASAVAVAAIQLGVAESPVEVRMPGGNLTIEWSGEVGEPLWMTGEATWVFEGKIYE